VNVEDVLKIVSVVLIPSIGAVVWLLSQVYGLRSDLRQIQTLLETEKTQNADRIRRVEENVEKIANALHDLTIDLARHGLQELKKKDSQK
jgi:Na+/phosphate symporter